MEREDKWMQKRLGRITASELGSITSASGKIIDGNVDYIRTKRWERNHGYSLPISSKAMEWGRENEPYAIEWYRANFPDSQVVYSQELPDIPFWTNPSVKNFGASPDAFTEDESMVLEIKNVYSNGNIEFFFDPDTSYEEKKAKVAKEHIDQNIPQDTDSPLAAWRGIVFDFQREEYISSIEEMIERINLFNAFIASKKNPSDFKQGDWFLEGDTLSCVESEKKTKKK